jgi:hypothetical protein
MKRKVIETYKDRWERGFAVLSKFRKRERHCCPSRYHVEGKFKLGQWVSVQRYYRDQISRERKRRLDTIGFVRDWIDYRWEQGFAALLKFKRREAHCCVPIFHNEGKIRLGWWVSTQRVRRRELSAERKARLNKIGFVWNADRIVYRPTGTPRHVSAQSEAARLRRDPRLTTGGGKRRSGIIHLAGENN